MFKAALAAIISILLLAYGPNFPPYIVTFQETDGYGVDSLSNGVDLQRPDTYDVARVGTRPPYR